MHISSKVSIGDVKGYLRYRRGTLSGFFNNVAELGGFLRGKPALHRRSPQGDGHPVLVIPAFTGHDALTKPMRHTLERKGYKAYAWEAGLNLGMTDKKATHLARHLKKIYDANGGRKVTIVGHSLGGFYARTLAQEFPEMVRAVVTINTPFGVGLNRTATPPAVLSMIDGLNGEKYSLNKPGVAERLLTPPPVPTTSIFSKTDAVAGWQACLNPKSPLAENIEVTASHIGGVWSEKVIEVVLDRLAQQEGGWLPYKTPAPYAPPQNPNWQQPKKAQEWRFYPKP